MLFTIGNRCIRSSTMKNLVYVTSRITESKRFNALTTVNRFPSYQVIYHYPLIRVASLINKLKFYQIVATGCGVPITAILSACDIITTEIAVAYAVCGFSWSLAFCGIGFFFHNRIGFMYMKDDEKTVKLSYTDFWGRRLDTDVEINDIWPLSDLPSNGINPLYFNLRRYSTKDTYKFNLKYGIIVDPIKFREVLGDPNLATKR